MQLDADGGHPGGLCQTARCCFISVLNKKKKLQFRKFYVIQTCLFCTLQDVRLVVCFDIFISDTIFNNLIFILLSANVLE